MLELFRYSFDNMDTAVPTIENLKRGDRCSGIVISVNLDESTLHIRQTEYRRNKETVKTRAIIWYFLPTRYTKIIRSVRALRLDSGKYPGRGATRSNSMYLTRIGDLHTESKGTNAGRSVLEKQ